jgi:hypothetical protein
MNKPKQYWIKERHNPQLGVYYVACGQLSVKEARKKEQTIYGENVMLCYETEESYRAALESLRKRGESVQA